jgi:CubicO group peptidase (beta-lactamase class C family)
MVVLVKGEQCYVLHYGTCSDESRLPVDGQTVFDTGSCGKAFTATAAALQVSRGKLAWDDPLCELVPEFQLYDEWVSKNVTLRDALGNRLCIQRETPLEFGVDASVPMTELLRRARFARRLYPFRDRFAYSNLGFMAASLAVSRSDGRPYAQFLKEELLTPLGMSRTLPVGGLAPGDVNAAVAYTNVNGKRTAVPEFVDANYEGCGGLYSSSDDLARWLRFNLGGGGELLPSAFETLHRPQVRMDPQRTLLWHTPPDALFPSYGSGLVGNAPCRPAAGSACRGSSRHPRNHRLPA